MSNEDVQYEKIAMDWVMEYQPERYNVLMRRFGWVSEGEGSEMKGETLGKCVIYCTCIVYIYIHGQDIYFNIYIYTYLAAS